jgi:hypothetical protein
MRAAFYVPTVAEAARARHLARRPDASLTYFEGVDLAVIAHGHVTIIDPDHSRFAELDATQTQSGGQSVREWQGHGVYLHFQARVLYSYARTPDQYPSDSDGADA